MSELPKPKELWIGLVELRPLHPNNEYLNGAKGAFTNIVTWAANLDQYRKNVELIAGRLDLFVADPWATHWGGRWMPLLNWQGTGKLVSGGGAVYPLYVSFYPSSSFSQLRMDGLAPIGGLQGTGWLCTSRGAHQQLTLSGTIYGDWRSAEGSLIAFRLVEPKRIDVGQAQGFFDLTGKWHGLRLIMDDRGAVGGRFRSGLKIEHASVNLDWGTYSDFKTLCGNSSNYPLHK